MAYISRHFRGELSLGVSFWINFLLINFVVQLIVGWLIIESPSQSPVLNARLFILIFGVATLIIYPWQVIGLWRSASQHKKTTQKYFWANAALIILILGVFNSINGIKISYPMIKDYIKVGFYPDDFGDYKITVINDGTTIHLTGAFSFGISTSVRNLLAENPQIKSIILDSHGGRIHEGRELSSLIQQYQLDTYSLKGCYSACVTAFISGENRYLGEGANLGFHQYRAGMPSFEGVSDISQEQNRDVEIYKKQGVSEDFIAKIFDAEQDDLWYPGRIEMLAAGVIHDVVSPSTIKQIDHGDFDTTELEQILSELPGIAAIKKYEPELYRELIKKMGEGLRNGSDGLELQMIVQQQVASLAVNSLSSASDPVVISFVNKTTNVLNELNQIEPILCMKFLYPNQFGMLEATEHVSQEVMMQLLEDMGRAISDSHENSPPEIEVESAEFIVNAVLDKMGDKAAYLDTSDLKNRSDYAQACNAVIAFYDNVLAYDKKYSANTLRYVFTE